MVTEETVSANQEVVGEEIMSEEVADKEVWFGSKQTLHLHTHSTHL